MANKRLMLAAVLVTMLMGATFHQSREIEAGEYRILRNAFKQGPMGERRAIAAAMRNGEVSRWEYRILVGRHRHEQDVLALENTGLNLPEERLVLAALTRQVTVP
jgi:hypothetical protein